MRNKEKEMIRHNRWTVISMCSCIVLLTIGFVCFQPVEPDNHAIAAALAEEPTAKAPNASPGMEGSAAPKERIEKARDVYYKTEGVVSGPPAPPATDSTKDYPRYNFESRILIWIANQQHLYYGSFVLAVPIFCMIIELLGMVTKDKVLAKRYDRLAYDFIK